MDWFWSDENLAKTDSLVEKIFNTESETSESPPSPSAKQITPEPAPPTVEERPESVGPEVASTSEALSSPSPLPDASVAAQSSLPEPIATEDKGTETPPPLEQFLCRALESDDLAGAYWWLRSQEARGSLGPLPSWLLEAVQASRWRPDENLAVASELVPITGRGEPSADLASQLLALSAALLPALTLPLVDVRHWLPTKLPLPRLSEFASLIRRFAEHGQKIRIQDLGERLPREEAESRVTQASAEARVWLEHAVNKSTSFQRGSHVWQRLVREGGPLHTVIAPAANDRRSQADEVSRQIDQWTERGYIVSLVHDLDAPSKKRRHDLIEGTALDQIVSWSYEACRLAKQWCRDVQHLRRLTNSDNWLDQQIDQLRSDLRIALPRCIEELSSHAFETEHLLAAAAHLVIRSLQQLSRLVEPGGSGILGNVASGGPVGLEGSPPWGLHHGLARRLLYLPEIDVYDDGQPAEASLPQVAGCLAKAESEQRTLVTALRGWLAKQDFRFTDFLLERLEDLPEWGAISDECHACCKTARQSLETRRDELELRIQNAVIDGVLSEGQRADLQDWLLTLDSNEVRDFSAAHRLGDEVIDELDRAYDQHCAEQREDWDTHREPLLADSDPATRMHIEQIMQAAFEQRDVRLLSECLSQLHAARAEGVAPALLSPNDGIPFFEEFLARYQQVTEAAVALFRCDRNAWESSLRSACGPEDLGEQRRSEATRALEAWNHLRPRPLRAGDPRIRSCVIPLLAFLGLEPADPQGPIEVIASGRTWTHLGAKMTDGRLAPVPQFGSLRHECYDLLCVWESPSAQSLLAVVNEAGLALRPTVLLYFGSIPLPQRVNLGRMMQRESLPIVMLDDILCVYLAGQRDARWPVFLRAALPFSAVNPYLPGSAGNVPREMFFGRKRMIAALADFTGSGSCLVYGGRQLGKSALLRRVQQLCHDPARGQYAIYEEIRNVGDPLADKPADLVWTVIRDELNAVGFFDKAVTAERPRPITDHIRKRLDADPTSRLLILLDEADSFLENDAEQNFQHVTELKNLMERTDRRVKIVFAGLHNVQRFQGIPNQPFAHLGSPLEVGTLEPAAAKALVRIPFETVGYRFSDESLVLKILSYTNYHPGLIQLFCHRLLTELHKRRANQGPPFPIDDSAVRAVYSLETQRDFRDRFNWTLRLDERYNAIIWSVIDDQLARTSRRTAVYSPAELLDLVRVYWPAAFSEMLNETFRGLLDELCGLGILLRVPDGYRLRSPNVMHLMGDREEINAKLNELEHRPAPTVGFKADSHRVLLGRTGRRSPLTYAQSRQIGRPQFGVGLIFGTRANGWDDLAVAAARLYAREDPSNAVCESVHTSQPDGKVWETWLREFLDTHRQSERLILLAHVNGPPADLEQVVRQSIEFCRRRERTERQWLRVLFCFDPAATWLWHSLPAAIRLELENSADAVTHLARWDEDAILFHLKQAAKMNLPSVSKHLLKVTGGWSMLLDEVFQRCADADDPRDAANQVAAELNADQPLATKFRVALGLETLSHAGAVIEVLRQLIGSPFEPAFLTLVLEESRDHELTAVGLLEYLLSLQVIEPCGDSYQVNAQVAQVYRSP
jgi:hypothetical protein